jgi:hypothetical protein
VLRVSEQSNCQTISYKILHHESCGLILSCIPYRALCHRNAKVLEVLGNK